MFEDIVKDKFEDIDLGDRDIATEIKNSIFNGFDMSMEIAEEGEDVEEAREVIEQFKEESIEKMVGMYIDTFTTQEILDMLKIEQTSWMEKKLRFQIKLQAFMLEEFARIVEEKEINERRKIIDERRKIIDDYERQESTVWDAKE